MSDSLSPDNRNPLPEEETPQAERTPTTGLTPPDKSDPERGLRGSGASLAGEPGQEDPAHIHERQIRGTGGASEEDSGDAPPELASDDQSLMTGNPPGTKPM